jgi:hypothetical protein
MAKKEKQRNDSVNRKGNKKRKLKAEWKRLDEFFLIFDLPGAKEEIWRLFTLAIGSDDECVDGRARRDMIFVFEYLNKLLTDTHALLQKEKIK